MCICVTRRSYVPLVEHWALAIPNFRPGCIMIYIALLRSLNYCDVIEFIPVAGSSLWILDQLECKHVFLPSLDNDWWETVMTVMMKRHCHYQNNTQILTGDGTTAFLDGERWWLHDFLEFFDTKNVTIIYKIMTSQFQGCWIRQESTNRLAPVKRWRQFFDW